LNAPIRAAVIGYGGAFNMGKRHAESMHLTGRMELRAVCDLDPSRTEQAAQDFPGIKTYNAVQDVFADEEIDLVTVITPHNTHAELAIAALQSGKHAIVEKPMCITVNEADAMIAAAKERGLMVSVFHNRRWDGDFTALKEIVEQGLIGDIFHVEMWGGNYGHPGTWWRSYKDISGGAFYDWGAHYVDWLLNLVDSPIEQIIGFTQKRMWMDVTNEDHVHSIVRFQNGAVADITMSHLDRAPKPRWRVLGTKGAIISKDKHFEVHTEVDGVAASIQAPYKASNWDAYYANVADHILDGAPLVVTPESARRVIQVIEGTGISAQTGKPLVPQYP